PGGAAARPGRPRRLGDGGAGLRHAPAAEAGPLGPVARRHPAEQLAARLRRLRPGRGDTQRGDGRPPSGARRAAAPAAQTPPPPGGPAAAPPPPPTPTPPSPGPGPPPPSPPGPRLFTNGPGPPRVRATRPCAQRAPCTGSGGARHDLGDGRHLVEIEAPAVR